MDYTVRRLEKLLRSYLDIRETLAGRSQRLHEGYVETAQENVPFRTKSHAKPPMNGKGRARLMEDLHVACLDIEEALPYISSEDRQLIIDYHITQRKTLDELCAERGNTSRGSMQRRVSRAVQRLHKVIENV